MEGRNDISVELSALSALVSGISRQTPYGVPAGYFDQLPDVVINRVSSGLTPLPEAGPTFKVPEGYFDGFAASVLARIKAGAAASSPTGTASLAEAVNSPAGGEESVAAELARLSATVSRISREMPYRLPDGYFDELSPVLAILRDKPAYEVPQGYFEELSPVLTVAHDRSTYRVPEGYFAELPGRILEKIVVPVAAAKVIPMGSRVIDDREGRSAKGGGAMHREGVLKGNWWKYTSVASIAACLLLIFSWPQVETKFNDRSVKIQTTHGLEKLSDQAILAYLDDQRAILAISGDNSTAAPDNSTALDMNEGVVKSLLGDVSDNDLQQYMEEHGKADDIATN